MTDKATAVAALPAPIEVHLVGGAVRDALLGNVAADRDYVVVGATPEQMTAHGFVAVGRDFPVFLHPETHEEYALARCERKTGRGYGGFTFYTSPEITLNDDLARRDLTINAMALHLPAGTTRVELDRRLADPDLAQQLVDPHKGLNDLKQGVLRHVGPAFSEDPLRLLRLARFAARWPNWRVDQDTSRLLTEIVRSGELHALTAERVWRETERALMSATPSRFFEQLRSVGALAVCYPELDRLFGVPQPVRHHPEIDCGVHTLMALDVAAKRNWPLTTRFAVLIHDLGKGYSPPAQLPRHHGHEAKSERLVSDLCERLKIPSHCRELAQLTARYHGILGYRLLELRPATLLRALMSCDVLRRPERLERMAEAMEADYCGRLGLGEAAFLPGHWLAQLTAAIRQVDAAEIASRFKSAEAVQARNTTIAEAIYQARHDALADCLQAIKATQATAVNATDRSHTPETVDG